MTGSVQKLILALTLCLAGAGLLRAEEDDVLKVGEVQDLQFGDVLFYFYQQNYFPAITRLMVAQKQGLLDDHSDDGELLRGGMLLSYGLHREAGDIFMRLLDSNAPQSVKDRAWYFLAKVWYQRAYYERASEALARITNRLPEAMEERRMMLHAQVLMAQGDFRGASKILDGWDSDSGLAPYARFNLGVALVRQGSLHDGRRYLERVGTMKTTALEMLGLRDRANLAMGYALIQDEQPKDAREALGRVRLDGPFSNKALLGAGWADTQLDDYQRALVPWNTLYGRDLLDPAVQESLLAVPYALGQLQASRRAADAYLYAIQSFAEESLAIDAAIQRIRNGELIEQLLVDDRLEDPGWSWRLDEIPDNQETRFLYLMLASNRFQEGLRNYRDLRFLQYNLNQWSQSVEAFEDMLDTRERAFAERLPAVNEALDRVDLGELDRERLAYQADVDAIVTNNDMFGFANAEELSQYQRLEAAGRKLDAMPANPETSELRERQRVLLGVLMWRLNTQFKARLWREQKSLRELDHAMQESHQRHGRVLRARDTMPAEFASFGNTITGIQPRLNTMIQSSAVLARRQHEYLQAMAIAELELQKDRLRTYQVQARFALATIYDRAVQQENSP